MIGSQNWAAADNTKLWAAADIFLYLLKKLRIFLLQPLFGCGTTNYRAYAHADVSLD